MGSKPVMSVPLPTIRRLPIYLREFKLLRAKGRSVVSCTHLSEVLGYDPTQIRKDLAVTGIVGRPKIGYLVEEIIEGIQSFLGWDNKVDAVLAGAGSLGCALMGYERLNERQGLRILAGFDVDKAKIGQTINEKPIMPLSKMPDLIRRMHIHIGIVTTPVIAAQEVVDLMVSAGILAIWNFTPAPLSVPAEVLVENVDLASSFAVLSARLTAVLNDKTSTGGSHVNINPITNADFAQVRENL